MRYKFLKQKAVFMIYLTISLMFTVYLMPNVFAQEEISQACCERTVSGDTCIFTDVENCDSSYNIANFQLCEDTAFCKVGCCVSEDDGSCSKQTSKATCTIAGYTWDPNADCSNVPQCQKGCCVLAGASCAYVTEKKCDAILLEYPELDKDFREAESEVACSEICREADRGCCVKTSNEDCIWTSRASCGLPDGIGGEGFYQDLYCSDENIPCTHCEAQDSKDCLDGTEDVYWFDSCGNPEGIADDCEYGFGSLCGHDEEGEAVCKDVNCKSTWDNPAVEGDGGDKINGESWCEFDGAIGPSLDLPGSRHMRHICLNGEEIIEPCKDFREEICRQQDVYEQGTTGVVEGDGTATSAIWQNYLYSEAGCTENRWKDCATKCYSAKDKTDEERKINMMLDKRCCENFDERDCFWAGNETEGVCIPFHPPGLKFWEKKAAATTTTTTTQAKTHEQCDAATRECKTLFTKDIYTHWNWVCMKKGNCECFGEEYIKSQNEYCRSLGDCGSHYNYIGEFSDEGFYRFWDHKYQGWDIIYNKGLGSKAKKESEEPAVFITPEMVGGFKEAWANAENNLYAGKASKDSQVWAQVTTAVLGAAIMLLKLLIAKSTAVSWISGIGMLVVLYITLTEFVFKKYETRKVTTTCALWQPPSGGDNCERCDEEYRVCSEYRCRSLGASCQFIQENEGSSRPACYNAAPNDVARPKISPWEEALIIQYKGESITSDYEIIESDTGYSVRGVGGKKVPAFASITFGIETDEPSKCRLEKTLKQTYNEMTMKFEEDYFDFKHNLTLKNLIPATDYKFFIICMDPVGNPKEEGQTAPYVIELSTDNSPDLEPPLLISASIPDQGYVAAGANTTVLTLLVDEVSPFHCKASQEDRSFELMNMNMSCSAMPQDSLFSQYAECQIELPVSEDLNTYYFRCQDSPEGTERHNENTQSYIWRAFKAPPLNITKVEPSGIVYSKETTLKVITSSGAEDGKAICTYDGIEFFETNASTHLQPLSGLIKDSYSYTITCKDRANNIAESKIEFAVDIDEYPPQINSILRVANTIKIILDELASCEHSFEPFTTTMTNATGMYDLYTIDPGIKQKFYFRCLDSFENLMDSEIVTRVEIKPPK